MCEQVATSVEHVPPKCLFPEKKDLSEGENHRKQLITVPSCPEHNSSKSQDDQYLLYCLVLSLPSNTAAEHHFLTKVTRTIKRKPSLINKLTGNSKSVLIGNMVTGEIGQSITLEIDPERLNSCFEHIAMGIFYHYFGYRWEGKLNIHLNFMLSMNPEDKKYNEQLREMDLKSEQLFTSVDSIGENKEIFHYKVIDKGESKAIRMYFYGENRLVALFNPNG